MEELVKSAAPLLAYLKKTNHVLPCSSELPIVIFKHLKCFV